MLDNSIHQNAVAGVPKQKRLTSIIIPWCNREEFSQSLHKNRHLWTSQDYEVIVVHAGGDFNRLKQLVAEADINNAYLVDIARAPFNKCLCLNIGVWLSSGQHLFLLDCDVLVSKELMAAAAETLCSGNFINVSKAIEISPAQNAQTLYQNALGIDNSGNPWLHEVRQTWDLVFAGNKKASFEKWQGTHGRSSSGLMFIQKQDFIAAGGSNSKIEAWGFEDIDLQIRLQAGLGITRVGLGAATHLTHDSPQTRFGTDQRNAMQCFMNYCRGDFRGTYFKDISCWEQHVTKYVTRGSLIKMIHAQTAS